MSSMMGFGAYVGFEHGWMSVNEDNDMLSSRYCREGGGIVIVGTTSTGTRIVGGRVSVFGGLGFIGI
jgi:N-acetylglucosamine kinase-like BadF-type ATPase